MKKNINIFCLAALFAITLCAGKCSKDTNPELPEQLPPITQTGANTFGCLINGKVWLPKGVDFQLPNMLATVDPTLGNGDLSIRVYRIIGGERTSMALLSGEIKAIGTYEIGTLKNVLYTIRRSKSDLSIQYCSADNGWGSGNPNNVQGFLKITKYDLPNGILSGEFEVSFNNTSCNMGDPVKITEGRFDFKL